MVILMSVFEAKVVVALVTPYPDHLLHLTALLATSVSVYLQIIELLEISSCTQQCCTAASGVICNPCLGLTSKHEGYHRAMRLQTKYITFELVSLEPGRGILHNVTVYSYLPTLLSWI